jgi:threonine aldolase
MAAGIMGKEAALYVPSGTMANLVCVLTHCKRGEEVILGDLCHIFLNEAGGMSALGGLHPRTVRNQPDGTMKLEEIQGAVRGDDVHWPRTRLVCLESTHNRCSGAPLKVDYLHDVAALAGHNGLEVHLDGARIFNAAEALDVDVKDCTRHVDSVSFCLSKGLSAPVGSMACGRKDFIAEARRVRKMLGGGMRQAGVIAAAGIVALERMTERLEEDHENARRLAEGIARIPGLYLEPAEVRTNIVYFDLEGDRQEGDAFYARLEKRGVRLLRAGPSRFRLVTHHGIAANDIDAALKTIEEVMGGC